MAPAAARMDFLSPRLLPKDLVAVVAEAVTEVDTEKVVSVAVADAADEVNVADDGLVVSANPGNSADVRACISMNFSNASIAGQVLAP